jgi:hypothetical protein
MKIIEYNASNQDSEEIFYGSGGMVKANETGIVFCDFLKENYPAMTTEDVIKIGKSKELFNFLIFQGAVIEAIGEYFIGWSLEFTLPQEQNYKEKPELNAISESIKYAGVKTYCPEYEPLNLILE